MSTMKKRIPMFLLALAMMVAMALPTFAASYRPNAQFGYLLNINGSTGSAYQGRALNLIKPTRWEEIRISSSELARATPVTT